MRGFILLTCLVAYVVARPETGHSYNGLQRGLPQNVHQLKPHVHQQLPAEHSLANFAEPPLATLAAPVDHLQHLDAPPQSPIEDIPQSSEPLPLSHQGDSYNIAYQNSVNSHESSGGYAYPEQTTVHKHIYVHVPPKDFEDEDVITPHVRHQAAPKQKHYKIVFIKAPAAPIIRPPVVPPPLQNEEKTLIYVLHKKPEVEQDIFIPTAAPTKPSKPEVYFIKYKTHKEEAPVYGPPPAPQEQQQREQQPLFVDMEPRHIETPSVEYGAPAIDDFFGGAPMLNDAPLTTVQTEEVSQTQPKQQQFGSDVPSAEYGVPPTMAAVIATEQTQPTLAAPSNQYLAPEKSQTMAPIIVEDAQLPASEYGPPHRFFLKKKK